MIKLIKLLKELTSHQLMSSTPTQYKTRANDISITQQDSSYVRGNQRMDFLVKNNINGNQNRVVLINNEQGKITPQSNIKFFCTCKDFKYENNWLLVTQKPTASFWSRSGPERHNKQPLKIKNPSKTIKACKHITAVLNKIGLK